MNQKGVGLVIVQCQTIRHMYSKKWIKIHKAYKSHLRNVKRKRRKRYKRRQLHDTYVRTKAFFNGDTSFLNIISCTFSESTKYLLNHKESPLSLMRIYNIVDDYGGQIEIPANFSLLDNPDESYAAIRKIIASLLYQKHSKVIIDYGRCEEFSLEAQVLLDILLYDILRIYNICQLYRKNKRYVKTITDKSKRNSDVRKMLFSIGSQAIHANKKKEFPDVIPYNLCVHKAISDTMEQIEQKEFDTTRLSDYVEKCLARMNRKLSPERMDDLCTVIGEILINAEEHSSTRCRYSIGYFEEKESKGNRYGLFRLTILNIGDSIYEKFHKEDCPNKAIVEKMKALSKRYTESGIFHSKKFEEETLWTLYSLQDGVTSVSPEQYPYRGNGSLRFIESFFNLKNEATDDGKSKMILHSGSTEILFDGTYTPSDRILSGVTYKVMTFNKSGNIEDKPDMKYVQTTSHFFPGTFISANIIF